MRAGLVYSGSARSIKSQVICMKLSPERIRSIWTRIACFLSFAICGSAFAHDPGLSSANLEIGEQAFTLRLTFNERDIAGLVGASPEELLRQDDRAQEKLSALGNRAVALKLDQAVLPGAFASSSIDQNNNVEFVYSFTASSSASQLTVESVLLKELPFGHRQAFAAVDASGHEIARAILSGREPVATVPLRDLQLPHASSGGMSFREFFLLGIHHIVTGYDHLLFLFALLLVCRDLRGAAVLITCFTIAHSLTLALSTFGLISLPGLFVEATIAASICYVGIENLLRKDGKMGSRAALTFGFGLIHGLGFAGVLHELGVAETGTAAVVPLLAFNSGVELGQIAIAAVVLPILWKLRQAPSFARIGIPVCSLLIVAAGAYWLVERTLLS